jgi:hypothetical protein
MKTKSNLVQYSIFDAADPEPIEQSVTIETPVSIPIVVGLSEVQTVMRDTICKEWRTCGHADICLDDDINLECVCFKDEPEKMPATATPKCLNSACISHTPGDSTGCGTNPDGRDVTECTCYRGPALLIEDPYRLAKERAHKTVTIELPSEYFDKKGPLAQAVQLTKGMVGIPESGILNKVFNFDENLYVIIGSLSSGAKGNISFYGYKLINRHNWNDECIPPVTIAARVNEPRQSHLSYTGCLMTYEKQEFVAYHPVEFVHIRPPKDPKALEG